MLHFQQRDGTLIFVFSRLRVVDEESERGKRKLSTLSFEDFLEALVRVATMKALPTRAELALLGARDAGTFLIELRSNPTGYAAFVKARVRGWDDPLRQPIHRCLEHLLSLIIRTIELGMPGGSAGGGADVNVFTRRMTTVSSTSSFCRRPAAAVAAASLGVKPRAEAPHSAPVAPRSALRRRLRRRTCTARARTQRHRSVLRARAGPTWESERISSVARASRRAAKGARRSMAN